MLSFFLFTKIGLDLNCCKKFLFLFFRGISSLFYVVEVCEILAPNVITTRGPLRAQ